jgi:histidinol-phosphate/aromatic aminotransferase/cobyric acid decarboxylase-like protein
MQFPNIYPDPESRRLREALAKDTGVGAEHLLVGCGADELIDLIMRYVTSHSLSGLEATQGCCFLKCMRRKKAAGMNMTSLA